MPNIRKQAYRDPAFEEFLFNVMKHYPTWAKEKMKPKELLIFKDDKSIRRWISEKSMDHKLLMLAKANIRFVVTVTEFNQESWFTLKNYRKFFKEQSDYKKRSQTIEQMVKDNTFATSSREILSSGYLIAQNAHTPYYYVNQDFKRVANAVDEFRLNMLQRSPESVEIQAAEDMRNVIAKFFLQSWDTDNYVKTVLKMEHADLRILMLLFYHRGLHIERRIVYRYMYEYSQLSISKKLGKLFTQGYIDCDKSFPNTPKYTIAETGIMAVNEVLLMVVRKTVEI